MSLWACGSDNTTEVNDPTEVDEDGDGVAAGTDCDDDNIAIFPGAPEICDGLDNDCDNQIDELGSVGEIRWYIDTDRDGYGGDEDASVTACDAPIYANFASAVGDCDDNDASAHNFAMERCDDLVDNDCDGEINEADANTDPETMGVWYVDADGDGYGEPFRSATSCDRPVDDDTWVADGTDCDDADSDTHPGAAHLESGLDGLCTRDRDQDGFGDSSTGRPFVAGTDCDDSEASVYPRTAEDCDGPEELPCEPCDGVDTDCTGGVGIDEIDLDGDLWVECSLEDGEWLGDAAIQGGGDCAPSNAARFPGADEVCNDADDDCDSLVDEDEALDVETFSLDQDGDGYSDGTTLVTACSAPSGYVAFGPGIQTDCDDSTASVSPEAEERCNSIDDDCDGTIDEASATDAPSWYVDSDDDGYGSTVVLGVACTEITGGSSLSTDCNDGRADVSPGATETCTGFDDDCDGLIDDDDPSLVSNAGWYFDSDGDGFGDAASPGNFCAERSGFAQDNQDCDDRDSAVHPDATEICRNGLDDDCDDSPGECDASGTQGLAGADGLYSGATGLVSAGAAVALFDVNEDDIGDVVIGAINARSDGDEVGGAYVFFGPATGVFDLEDADLAILGDSEGEELGGTLEGGQDLDGDGSADFLVSGCAPVTASDSAGRVLLFLGPVTAASLTPSDASATFSGSAQDDATGCAVAIGDTTDDGLADLIVGAPGVDSGVTDNGSVYILHGPVSTAAFSYQTQLTGESLRDDAGTSLLANVDVDADGTKDLIIGAPGRSSDGGVVYVLLGPATISTSLAIADARLSGQSAGDFAGLSVSATDLNSDGMDDLLIGAPSNDLGGAGAGAVYLVEGMSSGWTDMNLTFATGVLLGPDDDAAAGTSVASAGDTDGDGVMEWAVGGPGALSSGVSVGAVWRLSGPISGTTTISAADAIWLGDAAGDGAGTAIAGGVDIESDGFSDLLVGAPGADAHTSGLSDVGRAYLLRGTGL